MGSLRRRLFKIHRKETAIRIAVARIQNIPIPTPIGFPPLQELPTVAFQCLLNYLPATDIATVAQLSTQSNHQAQTGIVARARDYGYEGSDSAEARSFLDSMFKAVIHLGLKYIPRECIEFLPQIDLRPRIDAEATLRKMKLRYKEDPTYFRERFTRALTFQMNAINAMSSGHTLPLF